MALRYVTDFYSIQTGGKHHYEIEIDDNTYVGEPSVLELGAGGVSLDIESDEQDTFPTVMPSFLNIDLIADESFELNHIYTDNERALKVTLKQDGSVLGQYYVVPDGTRESFTTVPYNVSVRCIDGLGLMKNYDYTWSAPQASVLQIIASCLSRTGLPLNINTYTTMRYVGMGSGDIYGNTKINQERFDGMKCNEVLEQLLKEWVSGLVQMNGEWYLFRWPDLIRHDGGPIQFIKYDSTAVLIGAGVINLGRVLGTDGEPGIDLMHCNVDQVRSVNMPYKAVSIRYEYGFLKNLLDPSTSSFAGGIGPFGDFFGWEKHGGINAAPAGVNDYALITGRYEGGVPAQFIDLLDWVPVGDEDKMKLEITFNAGAANGLAFEIIKREGASVQWWNTDFNSWWNNESVVRFYNYKSFNSGDDTIGLGQTIKGEIEFDLPTVDPGTTTIEIKILPAFFRSDNVLTGHPGNLKLYEAKLYASTSERGIISELHTVTNNGNYTNVPDPVEVSTGESAFSGYLGTMFKADGITPTNGFQRADGDDPAPFLTIAAEDILYQHGFPMTRYEGSILGYFPVLSRFNINMLPGKYMPVKLSYDFKNNVVNSTLNQVNAEPVPHTVNEVVYEEEKPRQVGASDGQ